MIYIYDVETLPNFFSVIFMEAGQDKLVKEYIEADKNNNELDKSLVISKIKHKLFVIYSDLENNEINDLDKLFKFLVVNDRRKNLTLVGYNNLQYDDIMIDYIYHYYNKLKRLPALEITEELKKVNDLVIHGNTMWFEFRSENNIPYNKNYNSIDLQRLNNLHSSRTSLKQVSISLKWYKLEEYSMPNYTWNEAKTVYDRDEIDLYTLNSLKSFDRCVILKEVDRVISYNWNDVFITNSLFLASIDELQSRLKIKSKYNINVLSSPRSGTAEKFMRLLYSQYTGLNFQDFIQQRTWRKYVNFKEIVNPIIKFETDTFKSLLDKINSTVLNLYGGDSFKEDIIFFNKKYKMGVGGLHSKDLGGIFRTDEEFTIKDADVDSYYPRSIVTYKIKPKHLSVIIIDIISNLLEQRLVYKRAKDEINSYIYKIIINAIFGKMGDADSIFKDDKALYTVTVNNQLFLLMLIEQMEINGIPVISANTDGITCKVPRNKEEIYYKILDKWSVKTRFTLEVNNYDLYVRTSVNDYLAIINTNGVTKVKAKGDFDQNKYKDLASGYYAPIISKAITEYYVNGTRVEDTIYNADDILDFCMSQKTGGKFKNTYTRIDPETKQYVTVPTSKVLRFYVSNRGGILLKECKEENKTINILKGQYVTLLDMVDNTNITDRDINYNFYISKAKEIISIKVNNYQTKVMKKISGTLFDNLEDF